MRKHDSPATIAGTIRLALQGKKGVFVVVEGETDRAFYSYFFNSEVCSFKEASGKQNVIQVLRNLSGVKRVLGIVDADFWNITGGKPNIPNLFTTDTHDAETMVVKSDAFKKTINNNSNLDKLESFMREEGLIDIREALIKSSIEIGYIRLAAEKEKVWLNFKNIKLSDHISEEDMSINNDALLTELRRNTNNPINIIKIKERICELKKQNLDIWSLINGHDFVEILSFALEHKFGYSNRRYFPSEIEKGLRQAFETSNFSNTILYKNIKNWFDITNPDLKPLSI